jgi:hypothetical protein
MDSEDDFNSSMSGNDFDDDSEMDLEEGEETSQEPRVAANSAV